MSEHYGTKVKVTSGRKTTPKIFRYIQQLANRLDLQLQNASDWKEFFDSETVLIRQKFKDACEQALFSASADISRRVEDLLWRKGFYDVIQKLRIDKKQLQTDKMLCTLYNAHLNAAHCFYHHLLIHLKENFKSIIKGSIDWLPDSRNSSICQQEPCPIEDTPRKEIADWALKAFQRCLLYLGDLARYRLDIENNEAVKLAERLYHKAIIVFPENGMAHNQLGTLKQQAGYNDCEVAYHYLRCLHSVVSFDGAEENLKRTFDRNRWSQKSNLDPSVDPVEGFLFDFLDLQQLFLHERLQPKDYSGPCQSVIEKFVEILKLPEWDKVLRNYGDKNITSEKIMVKLDIKESSRLSGCLMIKIFTICILIVAELRKKESNVISAAIAFTFTLLSKLLDYIARTLPESPVGKLVSHLVTTTGAAENQKTNFTKREDSFQIKREKVRQMKQYRRRRRRKNKWSEDSSDNDSSSDLTEICKNRLSNESSSDLSEGELSSSSCRDLHSSSESGSEEEKSDTSTVSKCQNGRQCQKSCNAIEVPSNHLASRISNRLSHDDDAALRGSFEESFLCVSEYCYLPTLKVVSDWLQYSDFILQKYAKDVPCIWQKYANVLSKLPLDEIGTSALQSDRRKRNIWLAAELKNLSLRQSKALPEDVSLIGLPLFYELHQSLNFRWEDHTKDSSILQFIVRVKSLKAFGIFLLEKLSELSLESSTNPPYMADAANHLCAKDNKDSDDADSCEPDKNDYGKNQAQFMKALAKQRLMHDVSKLQDKMVSNNSNEFPDMPPYLILDSQALCRHLSLIRSLVKSREFIVIIPIQVVQALDELKKYNPSAREAIKFLEEEFRQRSRWLRSQKDKESIDCNANHIGKRRKNLSLEEWRFLQVVKCACYFASKHSNNGMVSVLTAKASGESAGSLGTRITPAAIATCEKMGIQIEPLVAFYQKWTAKKKS